MRTRLVLIAVSLVAAAPAIAQNRVDPLNDAEIDQLRDAAQEPEARLKLYVQFAQTRWTAIEKARTDPKVADKLQVVHDQLQGFLNVYDEMDDNIDTFVKRESDLRKPLKAVLVADSEFMAKLRALNGDAEEHPDQMEQYGFLLKSALETVDSSYKDHQELLVEQEEAAKHKKKEVKKAAPESHE